MRLLKIPNSDGPPLQCGTRFRGRSEPPPDSMGSSSCNPQANLFHQLKNHPHLFNPPAVIQIQNLTCHCASAFWSSRAQPVCRRRISIGRYQCA